MRHGAGLSYRAATHDLDHHVDLFVLFHFGQWSRCEFAQVIGAVVIGKFTPIDGQLASSLGQPNAGHGGLATTGADVNVFCFLGP